MGSLIRLTTLVLAIGAAPLAPAQMSRGMGSGQASGEAAEAGAAPAPGDFGLIPLTASNYILHPNDVIRVSIFREPDLEASQMLDKDGVVTLPLLEEVHLGGKTVREAENYLEQLYVEQDILKSPQVTVTVLQYSVKTFQIVGEVRAQGIKSFPQDNTELDILEAIAIAGGFTDFANPGSIRIIRRDANGVETTRTLSIKGLIEGSDGRTPAEMEKYMILPGDRIYVRGRIF